MSVLVYLASNLRDLLKLTLCVIAIICWLNWLWQRRHFYAFAMKLPGNFDLPLLGSLHRIGRIDNILHTITTFIKRAKLYTFLTWYGTIPHFFTADPEIIEKIMISPDLLQKGNVYGVVHDLFEGGLAFSPVHIWKKHRKYLNPTMSHQVLLTFFPIFNSAKRRIVATFEQLADGNEHNIYETLTKLNICIASETTMGTDTTKFEKKLNGVFNNLIFVLHKLHIEMLLSMFNLDFIFKYYKRYQAAVNNLRAFVKELVDVKLTEQTAKQLNGMDNVAVEAEGNVVAATDDDAVVKLKKKPIIFIDQAIKLYKENVFTYNDIAAESNMMITGAFETTSISLYSALVLLAMHPQIQERVFDEVQRVFPEKDFDVGQEHMNQLSYLEMVINDTIRLMPAVPMITRHAVKETRLNDELVLPKGMEIIISIYHLHRRTDIWGPTANQFNPDNFLAENISARHAYAYMPFSKGARNCIGWRYAYQSMKTLLAGMVRNYRFETAYKYEDLNFKMRVALQYETQPLLRIYRRP